jgi:hypothetical protein
MRKIVKYGAFGSLIVLLIVLAVATIIEKIWGTEVAHEQIYGAWWFVALWAILGVTALIYIISVHRLPFTVHRLSCTLLLHLAFIIILF